MSFFLRLALATPEELGFDPSVRRVQLRRETCGPSLADTYDIDVPAMATGIVRTFRTVGGDVLYAAGRHNITSRGTRVWKVREVVEGTVGESVYVLKDSWLAARSSPWQFEGNMYGAISSFITGHPEFEDCRENFLSVVTHGLVPSGDTDVMHHGVQPDQVHYRGPGGGSDDQDPVYSHKLRYRIVFEELGVPLRRLESDEEALAAIAGAVRGEQRSH